MTYVKPRCSIILTLAAGSLVAIAGCKSVSIEHEQGRLDLSTLGQLAATDIQLNDFTSSSQSNTTVDIAPSGNIVAAWDSRRQQRGTYGVYGRILNARGEALTPETQLNQTTYGHQTMPAVAATADGGAWFVWTTTEHAAGGSAIVARRFDRHMQPVADEVVLSKATVGSQSRPAIAVNDQGQTLVVWTEQTAENVQTRNRGLRHRSGGLPCHGAFCRWITLARYPPSPRGPA